MSNDLLEFLNAHPEYVEENIEWASLKFRVRSYLSSTIPPARFVTSVRAIVLREGKILAVRDPESTHITPGGRCEPDEVWEDTLRREIAEETGWHIHEITLLGVKHFHHLTPKPANYQYPYPDFCQLIYRAEAVDYDPANLDSKRYELEAAFTELKDLHLTPAERYFLNSALPNQH